MGISMQPEGQRFRRVRRPQATAQPATPGLQPYTGGMANAKKPVDEGNPNYQPPVPQAPKPPAAPQPFKPNLPPTNAGNPGIPGPIDGTAGTAPPPGSPPSAHPPASPTANPAGLPPATVPPPITPSAPPPPIDPGSPDFDVNFRGAAFTPGDDPRLAGAQGRTDRAADGLGGPGFSELAAGSEGRYRSIFGTPGEGARAGRYADLQDDAIAGLGGPSRTELAKQALADFDKQGEQALAQRFRKVGQTAAKFGRIGMGDVNAELGSIQGDYERDRLAKANELARSVAEGDISDRFRRVDATSGLRRGEAGIDAGLRDETFARDRSAIDYAGRDADRDIQDRYDQFDAAGSLEDRIYGQGRGNRDEYRTERGYQQGAAQQSLDNRIRERQIQEALKSNDIARAIALMQAGGRVPNLDQLIGG